MNLAADSELLPPVRFLLLHGVLPNEISKITEVNEAAIKRFAYGHKHAPTPKALDVVARTKNGQSAAEILRDVGNTGKGWLYRVLDQARITPTPFGKRGATNNEQRAKVAELYRAGKTYSQISSSTGVSLTNVKNILRRARDSGQLPEYGTREKATND